MSTIKHLVIQLGLGLYAVSGWAQVPASPPARHPEEGRPFIRAYRPEQVGGGGQNWAIVQDRRGVIYVGSTSGVLEFDGATWRLIETPQRAVVRSLAIGEDGRIYVGSNGELGYLAPDTTGELHYVSLLEHVPQDARQFSDVWRTFTTSSGVIFQSEERIFRWAGGTVQTLQPTSRFNRASLIDGRVYLTMPETGLNVLEGDTFRPLPGTASLGREVYPAILKYDDRRFLVGTRLNGLFLYDGSTLVPFATELDGFLKAHSLYRGLILPDKTIAWATTNGGLGIMDRQGHRVALLDEAHGLPSNAVYYLMADREGTLWAAFERGLAHIETPSAASFFDRADGYQSHFAVIRHEGRLYFAGGFGVEYLHDAAPGSSVRFTRVPELNSQCWWFEDMPDSSGARSPMLLVGCSDGLYEIQGTKGVAIRAPNDGTFRVATIVRSRTEPTRLWVGLFNGLASFRWAGGRWIDEGRLEGVADEVRSIYENPDGSLWAGTAGSGVLRLTFTGKNASGGRSPFAVERFGAAQGLPTAGVFVGSIGKEPYFQPWNISKDFFVSRFNPASKAFVREAAFDAIPNDQLRGGFGVVEGPQGELLVNFGRGTFVMRKAADGTWSLDRRTFSRFGQLPAQGLPLIEPDSVVWLGWQDSLVRFDLSHPTTNDVPFSTLIRRVTTNQNLLIFAGSGAPSAPRLPASSSTLRFEFAAPRFVDETATEFQTMLEGLDREWSPWTRESRRDYTNVGFGAFRFRVRARDLAGRMSDESSYAFTVLAPWYRTWWAYTAYMLAALLGIFAVDRIQRRRILAKERERAQYTEARLRAEAAEALARSESEGKKSIELLSDIGREITASLDFDTIFDRLYERVNQVADADVFGVGLYHPERHQLEYRLAIEQGKRYAPYTRDTTNPDQLPVWCIEHRQPVFINDLKQEYGKYLRHFDEQRGELEDGSMSREPQSVIYLPLVAKDRVLGIITIQSFEKHAYTERHLSMMQSLASYTGIALDNAAAYRQLNEQEHENRRLFEEAERARGRAEEADAAKSAFLSTVSHELRTPLTSVLGFAKIIKKRLDDRIFPLVPTDDRKVTQTVRQIAENLDVVVSEGERLTKLIDDVLDLAKIEAGKLEWHMEPVSVPDVIDHATAATSSLLEHKHLNLVKEVELGLPAVTGDRDRLIQVVINLISNAVKFTESGRITCSAARRGGEIVVSVTDTGVGIAPADQPKVFERFKQVGDTLTDKPKGTGLGLPICREIVEHHGGRIWVSSEPGHGSTFSFSLPVAAGAAEAAPGPIELAALIRQLRDQVVVSTPRTTDRKPRILVVDDEENIRELLTQEFTEADYQVSVAVNGRDAIEKVRRERPDLVVLDVMMPEMNGFDVAAILKNDPQTHDIPIVILSIVQDRERGFRLGVDRYLTKPIDTDLLFREVGTLIEQKKSHKHVLVVDEDASTVRTLTEVLKTRGYNVSEARGGELVEKAKVLQPDIIMLNSTSSAKPDLVQTLRFEKGLENVLFLVYQ